MAVVGIDYDTKNPEYTLSDLIVFIPDLKDFFESEEGTTVFNTLYEIANAKIYYSIFGSDWKIAMSWCIAHYLFLIVARATGRTGSTMSELLAGNSPQGVISSASVGGFSVSYDIGNTLIENDEAKFWNLTPYGMQLMALWKTKAIPQVIVATPNPLYENNQPRTNMRGYDIVVKQYGAILDELHNLQLKYNQLEQRVKHLEEQE